MFYVVIIFLILISFFYWLQKKELREFFLFWFIIFLPASSLLPEDFVKIPGFRFEVLFGLGFLFIDLFTNRDHSLPPKLIWKTLKPAVLVYALQMIFLIYTDLKSTISPYNTTVSETNFHIFLVRNLIFFIIFLRICFLLQDGYFRKIVFNAITAGFILLGISSFFSEIFARLGLHTGTKYVFEPGIGNVFRSSGLYRGDPTQFSAFLSTGFGFAFALLLLSKTKMQRIYLIIVMVACFLGNLNTGTRAGFIGIVSIVIFYLLVEKQSFSKKSFILFIVFVGGIYLLFNFGDFFLARLETTGEQLSGADNAMSREAVWGAHILYFIMNPGIWLFGTWQSVHVGPFILASHSTVLRYLVYAGIPFFILFYKNIFSIFSTYFKEKESFSFNFLYPLLGYLVPSLMNDNYDLAYLPLMLALGLFNPARLKLSGIFYSDFLKKKMESTKTYEKALERKAQK